MHYLRPLAAIALVLLLTGCQMVVTPEAADVTAPASSPLATPEAAAPAAMPAVGPELGDVDVLYEDPEGRFTVPIPTNWTAETADGYTVLASPQERIRIYIVTVAEADLEQAIELAWERVDPSFDLEPDLVTEVPTAGEVEAALAINYDTGTPPSEIVAASAELYEGTAYVLLVRADLIALQQRAAQLNIVQSGFTIAGLEETSLVGVEPRPLDDALIAEFEAYIADLLARFGIPGAAVAVVEGDEIVYAQGFGVQELGGQEPVTPETRMMIGSTGKTMTTMMMATMVDDGIMGWDTPVQEVLPQFAVADPTLSEQITMRNLVCACTGVPRRDFEILFNFDTLTAEDVIESLETFEFFTDFGEAFQYSNQLVATAGYAAAAAAGAEYGNLFDRYVQEMNQRVFEPIGMDNTTFSFEAVQESGNYALPHGLQLGAEYERIPLHVERFVIPLAPAGAPWSTVLDMGRYLITQLNAGVAPDGTRVVSAENLAITWEPQIPLSADASYGLGWIVGEYKGQLMLEHGGNTIGFTSDLAFLPEAELGISVLANAQASNFFNQAVRYRLLELVFDQEPTSEAQAEFGYETLRRQFEEVAAELSDVDPEQVEPYLGRYTSPVLGHLELRLEDGALVADAGEFRTELRAEIDEATRYLTVEPPLLGLPITFGETGTGEPQLLLGEGVTEYTFTLVE